MWPKFKTLYKAKENEGILLLHIGYSASDGVEDYYRVIAMSMYCQQDRLILDVNVIVTSHILLETEQMVRIWYHRSVHVWAHLSAYNNVIVIDQWTSHSQLEIVRVKWRMVIDASTKLPMVAGRRTQDCIQKVSMSESNVKLNILSPPFVV